MWKIALNIFLCFITGGLWLIPLAIYYLIKLFGGSVHFLDSWLPKKFTPNGTTKSFFFNPIQDYIDIQCRAKLSDYDESTKSFASVVLHIITKPYQEYNLFSDAVATLRITVDFVPINSSSTIKNSFDLTIYPNENGVCDYEELQYLSIKAKDLKSINVNVTFCNGRVTIPHKIKDDTKENSNPKKVSTIVCLECGNEVKLNESQCDECGCPIEEIKKMHKLKENKKRSV